MKVGVKLGKCIRDIVEDKVHYEDVLVIISASKMNPNTDKHWERLWFLQKNQTQQWDNGIHEDVYRAMLVKIFNEGKLHQPKMFGGVARTFKDHWFDIIPVLSEFSQIEQNSDFWQAWEKENSDFIKM